MIPIRDHAPSHTLPIVTASIVAVNVAVFVYQLLFVGDLEQFFYMHGMVPCLLTGQCNPIPGALPPALTLLTSLFLHAGWLHIGGNMLYFWIFGNNIEDAMGHVGFAIFYTICGVVAGLTQVAMDPSSTIINVGASGAIAGVLGAYLLLFPRAQVDTLIFLGFFINIVALPAILVLGAWFILQLFSGLMSLGVPTGGGVAVFAHIGGFVAGLILVRLFARSSSRSTYY